MSIPSRFDLAKVTILVDGEPYGEPLDPARVTLIGTGQGSVRAKVYGPGLVDEEDPESGYRWVEVDSVWDAEVVTDERRGVTTLTGVSEMLSTEMELPLAEALIRYDIDPRGCSSCR